MFEWVIKTTMQTFIVFVINSFIVFVVLFHFDSDQGVVSHVLPLGHYGSRINAHASVMKDLAPIVPPPHYSPFRHCGATSLQSCLPLRCDLIN